MVHPEPILLQFAIFSNMKLIGEVIDHCPDGFQKLNGGFGSFHWPNWGFEV
jgi:uncharacterized protein with HEPN domain